MKLLGILFVCVTLFFSCQSSNRSTDNELMTLRELVLLRTEGLALVEFVESKSSNPAILAMCQNLETYYETTHPEFLHICAGKKISLANKDFDLLWKKMSQRFSAGDYSLEQTCLRLCEENIISSIKLYEGIIQERKNEDMAYFSFIALPDLYNHQHHLEQLKTTLKNDIQVAIK